MNSIIELRDTVEGSKLGLQIGPQDTLYVSVETESQHFHGGVFLKPEQAKEIKAFLNHWYPD